MSTYEPPHDKINKMAYADSKESDQPGHLPSLISHHCSHEESLGPLVLTEQTAKTDQTGRMPNLIRVFAGSTVILLVLSWGGSYTQEYKQRLGIG